nr:ATP-grasp fold amidoligase family protein [Pantoea sp. 201603H]
MFNFKNEIKRSLHYFIKKMPWVYQDKVYYFYKFKKLPNIHRPILFNEKVLYRKFINGDYLRYGWLSDKYLVRDYIEKTIGKDYLIPLIYETDEPATLLELNSWKNIVIKPNHGSNMVNILLEEPDFLQKQRIISHCKTWLQKDYSVEAREIHYRYIKPRILVEKYIGDGKKPPIDYKFHMFNRKEGGFLYVLQVIYNRDHPSLSMNFYVNNLCDVFHQIRDTGLDISEQLPALTKALELSKVLASDVDYVRVDWYIHENQVYFGELTFTPGAGLVTGLDRGLDRLMGDMWLQDHTPLPLSGTDEAQINIPALLKKV